MAAAEKAKLPETKAFRVAIGGATYASPTIQVGLDGSETVVFVSRLGLRGETIELIDREAQRLTDLEAIKPEGEPLSYDEMDDKQLDAKLKEFGVTATSSGADQDKPLREDKINALLTYDQGRAKA